MVDNPQALMAVSLGLVLFCIIVIVLFIVFVHTMPGKIARKRGNPQAEAIEILSLLGLLIFPLWMAALVWSFMRPFTVPVELIGREDRIAPKPVPEPEPAPAESERPAMAGEEV